MGAHVKGIIKRSRVVKVCPVVRGLYMTGVHRQQKLLNWLISSLIYGHISEWRTNFER